ncbi:MULTISPECIES: metallophosphoesterase [Solimonas]|nr:MULTISPECIES: metallophosphoesterase [Solimonas]MDM4771610.1 metallophosphoesterase [Solimonas sp. SE-A11]HEX4895762.1 metallophosphoesterase [Solimonas sp.]
MLFEKPFITLPPNSMGRDFCIGDLHGCLEMLNRLLFEVRFNPRQDRLFSVGDLVHRGPSSVECLRLAEKPWFYAVMGNHEAMQMGAYRGAISSERGLVYSMCEYFGPNDPLRPGNNDQARMEKILSRLPLAFEILLADGRKVGIVHAGLPNEWTWADVSDMHEHGSDLYERYGRLQRRILWDRSTTIAAGIASIPDIEKDIHRLYPPATRFEHELATCPVLGLDLLVSGHTTLASRQPLLARNRLHLDTGAGMEDGRLTLVELLSGYYWQVPDPRREPDMPVTEYASIPTTLPNLSWLSDSERAVLQVANEKSRDH